MLKFSNRWIESGAVFGYYDNVYTIDDAISALGLDQLPVLRNISLGNVSGLNNTLIIKGQIYDGTEVSVLFSQYVTPFAARVELSGALKASFGPFGSVDLASLSFRGDTFTISIAGAVNTYSRGNLGSFTEDLIEEGVSAALADDLTDALQTTLTAIDQVENRVLSTFRAIRLLDYQETQAALRADLASNTASSGGQAVDIWNIQDVIGSTLDDTISGGDENNSLSGGAGSDILSGGGGNDVLDGGAGSDNLSGGGGNDTYIVDGGDTVSDSDGRGRVIFNGVELKGAERPAEDEETENCDDEGDGPNNGGDQDDRYIGAAGEEYIRSGGGLTVTLGGASITISGWSQGDLGIRLEDEDKDPTEWSPPDCFASPLVFDLDGDGIELTRLAGSSAYFDIDMDGAAERTAWVASDDGILAIDLNGNGRIDGAQELFGYGETFSGANGASTALPGFEDGGRLAGPGGLDHRYTSGFEKLAEYDLNLDGVINSTDTFFTSLRMWRDLNGDGVSEADELFRLSDVGVAEISLTAVQGDRAIQDSIITDTGSFVTSDGATREVSDVWFRFDQYDTRYDQTGVTAEIAALPNIKGTGGLADLHVAMARDAGLRSMVEGVLALDGADLAGFRSAVEAVLFRWAQVEDADPYGRGASANGQRLALIEVVTDTPFAQWSGANPRTQAGLKLDLQYELILRDTMVKFAASGDMGADLFPEIAFNNAAFIDLAPATASVGLLDQVFTSAPAEWAAKFAHLQAGVMMLDRVYQSFADVRLAGDDGAAYRAEVEARLTAAGFADIDYQTFVAANIGSGGADSMITGSMFGLNFYVPTEVVLTGAGDDELKWGNKDEILLWGEGQGNDEVDADIFFAQPQGRISNVVRMQGLTQDDITITRSDGPIGNDVIVTITATGETLTFRNLLLADNTDTIALEFADGETLTFASLANLFSSFAETGTAGDDTLYQRNGSVLDGGAGDDVLMGGGEATTYVFGRGYGHDEILDARSFGPSNTVQFGPGIAYEDLRFDRPAVGDKNTLIITIIDTGETLTIRNQFSNTLFKVDNFVFADGDMLTAEDILFDSLNDVAGDQVLYGSGREEGFGFFSEGNDTFVGLGGDDTYVFGAGSGQDVIEDGGAGRYDPARPISFYRSFFVDRGWGDVARIEFALDELTMSRSATRLTFLHEASGAQLIVDNTKGFVERYQFAGDDYVYTLPEIMKIIDDGVEPETGGEDDDLLTGDDSGNNISGGLGNDTILGLGGPDTLNGDEGDDLLDAGDRGETPSALRDNNTLNGGTGNDTLLGGWENDSLSGGAGDDRLVGDYGDDTYIGGLGDDVIISESGDAVFVYNLGDGNDTILSADSRFDQVELQFGAGITPADVTYSIELVNIAGLSDYYEFDDETGWGLRIDMPDGAVLRIVGSPFSPNFMGMDAISFTETGDSFALSAILADLYATSDADQIFIGSSASDVFAPGGGFDQFFMTSAGIDTISIGLNDGQNVVTGPIDRIAFEGGVLASETVIERSGPLYEDFNIILSDGTNVLLNNMLFASQAFGGIGFTQGSGLGELRFADGTVLDTQDILDQSAAVSAGDDLTTGDLTANSFAQTTGDDTLRGSGGADSYAFGYGAGADEIEESAEGFAYYADNGEFTFYDLSLLREEDVLSFGPGITLADLTLTRTGATLDDLRIDLAGSGDSLLLRDQFRPAGNWGYDRRTGEAVTQEQWQEWDEFYTMFGGGGPGGGFDPRDPDNPPRTWGDAPLFSAGIELFAFDDGTTLTRAAFEALVGASDNQGDNDLETGNSGGILDGGAGNDLLRGGTGDDAYVFDAGYGSDRAVDAGGMDTIAFGAGLDRGGLTLTRTGPDLNDLLIEVGGQQRNALYVEGQFAGDGREIEVFTFADGVTLSAADIRQSLLSRSISNGDDVITGFETADIINARKGDDVIEMRGGNDVVDGGEGFDIVVLRGPSADYVVEVDAGRITVTDLTGRDGVNRLYNVERLVFADDPIDGSSPTRIDLVENQAPVAGALRFDMAEDAVLSFSAADILAAASDPDGASVSLISLSAVSAGTLTQRSATTWDFAPAADFNGTVSFEYVVEDAGGLQATGTATIAVAAVNDAPVSAMPLAPLEGDEDTAFSFTLPGDAFADVDGDSLSLSATLADGSALPGWLSLTGAVLAGTPPANLNGPIPLRITASDGSLSVTQSVMLIVSAVNDAPEAVGTLPAVELTEGDLLFLPLSSALFADVDGDEIGLTVTDAAGNALPEWLIFDAATATLSGVVPAGAAGVLSLLVVGSDGQAAASLPLSVTITSANTAPIVAVALADVSSAEDAAIDFALPAGSFTDADGDALVLTAGLAGGSALPEWLSFDGTRFTGQPPADFNGALTLQVTASDGVASVSDSFTLTVTPVNDAPIGGDDQGFVVAGGQTLTIAAQSLLANDSDADGDSLSILSVSNAVGGAVQLAADGSVRFVAAAGFAGAGGFDYTLSDGSLTAQASVALTVEASTDPYDGWRIGSSRGDWMFGAWFAENKIFGANGNDRIYGGLRDDRLHGGNGKDTLSGSLGDDDLDGNAGNDRLYGGLGDDTLAGGTGNDSLWGGSGKDVFVFRSGDGKDIVQDFDKGGWWHWWSANRGDRIALDVDGIDSFADVMGVASAKRGDVILNFGDGDRLTLNDIRLSDLNADDFIFL